MFSCWVPNRRDSSFLSSAIYAQIISYFKYSNNKIHFTVPNEMIQNGLFLRRWRKGDKIVSSTTKKHTLVSDLFINMKLSSFEKLVQPILVDNKDQIVWIPGIAHSEFENKYNANQMKVVEWVRV